MLILMKTHRIFRFFEGFFEHKAKLKTSPKTLQSDRHSDSTVETETGTNGGCRPDCSSLPLLCLFYGTVVVSVWGGFCQQRQVHNQYKHAPVPVLQNPNCMLLNMDDAVHQLNVELLASGQEKGRERQWSSPGLRDAANKHQK